MSTSTFSLEQLWQDIGFTPNSNQREAILHVDGPSLLTRSTFGFQRAVIAVLGAGAIAAGTLRGMRPIKAQFFACRTEVYITLRLIAENHKFPSRNS